MEALLDGPKSVGELVLETGLSQPGVSQHLNCLRCCGLVLSRRQGRRVYYRIASPRMLRLLRHADGVLEEVAERIRACEKYQVSSGGRR